MSSFYDFLRSGFSFLLFAFTEPYVPVAAAVNLPPLHIPPPGYPPGKIICCYVTFLKLFVIRSTQNMCLKLKEIPFDNILER